MSKFGGISPYLSGALFCLLFISIAMAQAPNVAGTVLDASGKAIVGAKVTLRASDKVFAIAITNNVGRFAISTAYRGSAALAVEAREDSLVRHAKRSASWQHNLHDLVGNSLCGFT